MKTFFTLLLLFTATSLYSQELIPEIKGDSIIYHLTIDEIQMNITGKNRMGMAINGSIPGPTLRFQEGKYAVIHVTNKMEVETSVHWHGLLLPNYMDGVAYLTTPPIKPNKTLTYHFPLIHSGTYWYHSHTGLQEQKGIYGSIIIDPKEQTLDYDHDLVLVLSDWTDDNPHQVLKNLKRHNEWYGVKIGSAPSLLNSIRENALGAQFKLWSYKMPGMHISDIPYDAFLINGKTEQVYDEYEAGDKVRIRVINAGASSYFWLSLGGGHLNMVSADGIDIQPIHTDKVLIGLAETYDFIVEVEEGKSLEFRATPQDVTGSASAFIGSGERVYAQKIPFPNYQKLNKAMAVMHSGGGHDMSLPGNEIGIMSEFEHKMGDHETMDHAAMGYEMGNEEHQMNHAQHQMDGTQEKHHAQDEGEETEMDHSSHNMDDPTAPMLMMDVGYNNSIIKAKEPTTIHSGDSLRQITFNLTGNMLRYIWSINGKTLSGAEKILIKKGEVVRVTLNNETMMHHPMHLHGHFFRVLNGNGEFSPLKHTVDVPPMSRITIEFEANEEKDWFFHCHLLYHMKAGMARIFSYEGSTRDERLAPYPVATLYKHDKKWFTWGMLTGASQFGSLELTHSNIHGEINLMMEAGWNENYEFTLDYEHFVGDFTRLYGGVKSENETKDSFSDHDLVGRFGLRHMLLYILDADISLDHKLRPELGLDSHLPLTQRLYINSHYEWKTDFGITEKTHSGESIDQEWVYNIGLEYLLNKNFALTADYDNRFGVGGGLNWRF